MTCQLCRAEGSGARHHRAERRRQIHAVQPDHRQHPARRRPDHLPRPRRHPHARRWTACAMGVGRSFQIPQPFEGLTVFENLLTAAAYRPGQARGRRSPTTAPRSCATPSLLAGPTSSPERLSLLDRKRLELARAMATGPELLLLDEIAGGLTEGECQALVATIRGLHAQGHHDHLDRACPARAELRGRTASGSRLRPRHRHRRPGRRSWPRKKCARSIWGWRSDAAAGNPRPHRPLRPVQGAVRRRPHGRRRANAWRSSAPMARARPRCCARSPASCATRPT